MVHARSRSGCAVCHCSRAGKHCPERAALLRDALLGGTTGFGAGFSGLSAQEAPPMTGSRDEPSVRIMAAGAALKLYDTSNGQSRSGTRWKSDSG